MPRPKKKATSSNHHGGFPSVAEDTAVDRAFLQLSEILLEIAKAGCGNEKATEDTGDTEKEEGSGGRY